MKVSKKSLNYRMWKRWHAEGKEPKNLCRYFWFCIHQWSLLWLFVSLYVVFVSVIDVFSWFFGYRQNGLLEVFNKEESKKWMLTQPYKTDLYNWTRRNRRYRVAPWEYVAAALFIWYFVPIMKFMGRRFREVGGGIVYHWEGELITIGIFLAIVVFAVIMCRKETWQFLKAQKIKWCPTIEVTE